jgi:hypothetical protein
VLYAVPVASKFPDPFLTANIYYSNYLDEVLHHAVAPFRRALAKRDAESRYWLWVMRYSRGGEHLKVRLHGPENLRINLRDFLTEAVERCFASAGETEPGEQQLGRQNAPPIDAEDNVVANYPDRTLLWTEYRRSPVSLGGKPFLLDDEYVALLARCLAEGCEITLSALTPDSSGRFPHRVRQTTLLKALIAGLAAFGFTPDERALYLSYHRDWLLRAALARSGEGVEKGLDILARFDSRLAAMGASIHLVRQAATADWDRSDPEDDSERADSGWRSTLAALRDYVAPFLDNPDYHLDPFAKDPIFPILFKPFNSLANQLGLDSLNEAFTHHLLLRAACAGSTGGRDPFRLIPE